MSISPISKIEDIYIEEGRMAFQEEKSLEDCPYAWWSNKRRFWIKGFESAESTHAIEKQIYQNGWDAYQVGHSAFTPYKDNPKRHDLWLMGYGDAQRAADPDGLAPRPKPYVADINIPRERLFSTEDTSSLYDHYTMAFTTTLDSSIQIRYIMARSQEEAFGIAALELARNKKDGLVHWLIQSLPLEDLIERYNKPQTSLFKAQCGKLEEMPYQRIVEPEKD